MVLIKLMCEHCPYYEIFSSLGPPTKEDVWKMYEHETEHCPNNSVVGAVNAGTGKPIYDRVPMYNNTCACGHSYKNHHEVMNGFGKNPFICGRCPCSKFRE